MLTKVILEGEMGKRFGREWAFAIDSPGEALRMVDANVSGVFVWIKQNLAKYANYKVICKYEGGRTEELDKDSYQLQGKVSEIRFVPLVEGAGGGFGRIILGVALIALSFLPILAPFKSYMISMGVSMILGGVIQLLTVQPKKQEEDETKNKTSYFFDGPVNTTQQGVPVQLIYGRVLVGSHAISAELTIDRLM